MANPTVFVSSTFYDLRYVREGVKRFIESFGYTAILSEEGTVFYDPKTSAAEACLSEVGNANIFVLIIGGRYGSAMPDSDLSVTNAEFQKAVQQKIPVFALVENGTYNDFSVYRANSANDEILTKISFPHADSPKIFEFIEQVQGRAENNALVPFRGVGDIESYLRSQWAGMLHAYLTRENDAAKVVDSLGVMAQVNARVELLAEQILRTVGTRTDRVIVRLLQEMVDSSVVADLRFIGATPTPVNILKSETFDECASALGVTVSVTDREDGESDTISGDGQLSAYRKRSVDKQYRSLRNRLTSIVTESGITISELEEHA